MRTAREQALSTLLPVRDGAARDVRSLLRQARDDIERSLAQTRTMRHLRALFVDGAQGAAPGKDALLIETSTTDELERHARAVLSLFDGMGRELLSSLEDGDGADPSARFVSLVRAHQLRVGALTRFTPDAQPRDDAAALRGAGLELALLLPADLTGWVQAEEDLVALRRRASARADRAFAADPGSRRGLVLFLTPKQGRLRRAALRALLRSREREVFAPGAHGARPIETRCVPIRGRGLLFSFDFEGRLDAALEELAGRDGAFLNALFAQTAGFPRCAGTFAGGVRDEERFHLWIDAHRLENGACYVAPHGADAP
jgi:hypothetical protein